MPDIYAQTPDGAYHQFPEGTVPATVDRAMKGYISSLPPVASVAKPLPLSPLMGSINLSQGPAAPAPIDPQAVTKFRDDFFNTLNPNANIPMQTAHALAKNPNDPAYSQRLLQMSPVAQAAIRQKAQEIAAAPVYDPQPVNMYGGFGQAPVYRDPKTNARTPLPQPHDIIGTMLHGPEGYRELEQAPGALAELTRMAEGSLDPQNLAFLGLAGGFGALGKVAEIGGKAITGAGLVKAGIAGMMGTNAVQRARTGDYGGAAVDATLGLLPFAHAPLSSAADRYFQPGESLPPPDLSGLDLSRGAVTRPPVSSPYADEAALAPPPASSRVLTNPQPTATLPVDKTSIPDENIPAASTGALPVTPPALRTAPLRITADESLALSEMLGHDNPISSVLDQAFSDGRGSAVFQVSPEHLETLRDAATQTKNLPGSYSRPALLKRINGALATVPAGESAAVPFVPQEGHTVVPPADTAPAQITPAASPETYVADPSAGVIAASPKPTFAANINLGRLNTPEAVKQHIADTAEQNAVAIEQARGGVIPQAETVKAAAEMGLTPDQLEKAVPGANPAKILAIRDLHLRAAEDARAAAETYRGDPSSENLSESQKANAQFQAIQETLAGHTAEAGRSLAIFKQLAEAKRASNYTHAGILEKLQAAKGEAPITVAEHAQIADLTAKLEAAEARAAALETKRKAASDTQDETQSNTAAEKAVEAMKPKRNKASQLERADVRAEKKAALDTEFDGLKQKFVEKASQLNAGLDPSVVPILKDMAANRVKSGALSVADVVDAVHAAISDHIEGVTKREVRDAISGYGQGSKIPRATQLAELKEQMRLVSQIEDAQAGKLKPAQRAVRTVSDTVKGLRDQLSAAKEENAPAPSARKPVSDEAKLQSAKTQLKNHIDTLEARIKAQDFSKTERTPVRLDKEGLDLRARRDALKAVYDGMDPANRKAPVDTESAAARASQVKLDGLNKRLADLQAKNAAGDTSVTQRAAKGDTLEQARVREQIGVEQKRLTAARKAEQPPADPLKSYKTQTAKAIADLQRQIDAGQADAPKTKQARILDAEAQRLKNDREALKRQLDAVVEAGKPKSALQKGVAVWKAGLLSSPRTVVKVLAAHGLSLTGDELSRIPSSVVDAMVSKVTGQRTVGGINPAGLAKAGIRAATQGVRESADIMRRGETKANLQNIEAGHKTPTAQIFDGVKVGSKAGQAYLESVQRMHSVAYRTPRLFAYLRAAQEYAGLQARGEGLKGAGYEARVKDLMDNDEQIHIKAAGDAEQAVFMNENSLTRGINQFKAGQEPWVRAGVDTLLPFHKAGSNIATRVGEYSAGAPLAILRLAINKAGGKPFDAAAQRQFSQTMGRQTVGVAAMATGAYLASHGLMTGYGSGRHKEGDLPEGAIKIGNRWAQVGVFGPVGPLMVTGATLHERERNGKGALVNFAASEGHAIQENPLSGMAKTMSSLDDVEKAAGRQGGSIVPQALSDIAAQLDSERRKPGSPADYLKVRIPGIRETVPGTGQPESNKLFDPTNSVKVHR